MKMKFSLLVFVLTSFVINACSGLLSGDPAPGRSPGPPESKATTFQQSSSVPTIVTTTTSTTANVIHPIDTNQSTSFGTEAADDDTQHKTRFNQEPPIETDINSNSHRHTEHIKKTHGNLAVTHHNKFDKLGKIASKTGSLII